MSFVMVAAGTPFTIYYSSPGLYSSFDILKPRAPALCFLYYQRMDKFQETSNTKYNTHCQELRTGISSSLDKL
jgi:hypothetical protein